MIWHQAIAYDIAAACQLGSYFLYKEKVITLVEKYWRLIIAAVINMVIFIRE
jgi:hypothetical protein